MSSQVVGVDIGSHSVRAVELKNTHTANPVVVRLHEVPLSNGSVRRGEVLEVSTVAAAIKRLWSEGNFTSRNVILGMGGTRVLSRDMVMPKAPLSQIKEALPLYVGDMLPVPVSEALLDFYPIREEVNETGPAIRGLVIAAVKEAVTANVAAVSEAGLHTIQVDLTPFALARALAPIRTSTGLAAIISIGAHSTNVVVVLDGVPQFVRIVAAGGDDVTTAIATGLQVSLARAEEIKREVGLGTVGALPEQLAAIAIAQEVASTLLISLRDTLSFYVQSYPHSEFDRIILSGGGSRLIGLAPALRQLVVIPVVQAPAVARTQMSTSVKSRSTREQIEAMTTAYGLALGTSL